MFYKHKFRSFPLVAQVDVYDPQHAPTYMRYSSGEESLSTGTVFLLGNPSGSSCFYFFIVFKFIDAVFLEMK